ncbi:unnamed protein product [Ectocarpus sp. CCAP 1310/34]|nr:unnamed protein product [Ectocarpus sp. CCAP 1310/34]
MDVMKLDNVQPLPLEFNGYVEGTLELLLGGKGLSQIKLLKHLQNVCIVYACLAVKRNAGIVSTEAKYKAAAKGYKDIAVPGFFKWLKENGIVIKQAWLTFEVMGRTSLNGAPVLFTDGKKLWKRFDKVMREMKKTYNKVWDRCVDSCVVLLYCVVLLFCSALVVEARYNFWPKYICSSVLCMLPNQR